MSTCAPPSLFPSPAPLDTMSIKEPEMTGDNVLATVEIIY